MTDFIFIIVYYNLQVKKRMTVGNHQYSTLFVWFQRAQVRPIRKLCSVLRKKIKIIC